MSEVQKQLLNRNQAFPSVSSLLFYAIALFSGNSALQRSAEIHYFVFAAASNGWIGRCVGEIGVDPGLKQQRELEDNPSAPATVSIL